VKLGWFRWDSWFAFPVGWNDEESVIPIVPQSRPFQKAFFLPIQGYTTLGGEYAKDKNAHGRDRDR
jgi:hypothetical protein